jgi:hypothetical protein
MSETPEEKEHPEQAEAPLARPEAPAKRAWALPFAGKSTSERTFPSSEGPASALLWVTRALLAVLLGAYLVSFAQANFGMLTDPTLQNDDARTILFPFHAYGSQGTLGDDPIAEEMLSAVPWGVRLLYLMFVPIVDVYVAAKLVQVVAFGVLFWAAVVLARARRAGLGAAALLVFFFLHTPFVVDRVAGGLPRAFGFPCFALWLAGILAQNRGARFAAPVILALSYPSVMNMILAAEGLLSVQGIFRLKLSVVLRRFKRYAILVGVCLLCVLPATIGSDERGPIHTLEQAQDEPAFGKQGRLWILPFEDPVKAMSEAFLDPARPHGARPLNSLARIDQEKGLVSILVVAVFFLLPLLRLGPAPLAVGAFFVGTAIIYALSRVFAFALYSPERYYSFGMRMACLAIFVGFGAHVFYWLRPRSREIARNIFAFCVIGALWLVLGSGLSKDTGMTINRRADQTLYDFIRTTPKESRFAAHLLDGDGIPFWGARAHTGSFETLQPWFTKSWARQKERTMDTLAALYATDEAEVLRFTEQYGITHLLINRSRMGRSARGTAGSFEPFTSATKKLLLGKDPDEFVLGKPPKEAVVFKTGRFQVVSVEKLKRAWSVAR